MTVNGLDLSDQGARTVTGAAQLTHLQFYDITFQYQVGVPVLLARCLCISARCVPQDLWGNPAASTKLNLLQKTPPSAFQFVRAQLPPELCVHAHQLLGAVGYDHFQLTNVSRVMMTAYIEASCVIDIR